MARRSIGAARPAAAAGALVAFARHESRPHRHRPDERVDIWIADVELVRDR